MNLFKDSIEELRAAFDLAEGEGFFDYSMSKTEGHDQSLGAIIKTIKSGWQQPEYQLGICLYGSGGFHRYFVKQDGEVIADPYYGLSEAKAKFLGFRVRGQ